MSEELNLADANPHALHAERAALRQAAQTAGITLWYSTEDEAYIATFPSEPTLSGIGDTPGAALVELLVATRMGLDSTRADLDTLRNGVVRLGAELESARAYADQTDAEYDELRDRALGILRAARLLVAAWRQERQRADYWEGAVDLYRVALQRAREPRNDDATE